MKQLKEMPDFKSDKINTGPNQLEELFNYLMACDKLQNISFDLSLARGLDYYTGELLKFICEKN